LTKNIRKKVRKKSQNMPKHGQNLATKNVAKIKILGTNKNGEN